MRDRLYKRGGVWWCRVRNEAGRIVRRSTGCRDYQAAEIAARTFERESADPTHAAAARARLDVALNDLLADLRRRKVSDATMQKASQKLGHFVRVWGADLPLARIDARKVLAYIDQRQGEKVTDFTIKMELGFLGQALKIARHVGTYHLELDRVMPPFFSGKHKPKTRAPSPAELRAVLEQLPHWRGAHLAFFAATGARLGEAARAQRSDVDWQTGLVRLRGTKTERSARTIPISPLVRSLLSFALGNAPGKDVLFRPWGRLHRDVAAACVRAGVAPVTPNDLRRAFTTWHRAAGIEPATLAALLGHTTDKLVQTTYGRLSPAALAGLLSERLAGVSDLYAPTSETESNVVQLRQENSENCAPPARVELAANALGKHGQNARSVGNKKAWERRREVASVPELYSQDPDQAEGIFNPARNGSLTRENKHIGADRDAECAANGMSSSASSEGIGNAPRGLHLYSDARVDLQPGGGLDEPGTTSEAWTPDAGDAREASGPVVVQRPSRLPPGGGPEEPGILHPVAAAYLAANAGYGMRGRAWEGAR